MKAKARRWNITSRYHHSTKTVGDLLIGDSNPDCLVKLQTKVFIPHLSSHIYIYLRATCVYNKGHQPPNNEVNVSIFEKNEHILPVFESPPPPPLYRTQEEYFVASDRLALPGNRWWQWWKYKQAPEAGECARGDRGDNAFHCSHLLEGHGLLYGLVTVGDCQKGLVSRADPPGEGALWLKSLSKPFICLELHNAWDELLEKSKMVVVWSMLPPWTASSERWCWCSG